MAYLWGYVYLSLVIGLILTIVESFFTEEGKIDKPIDREQNCDLQQAIESGDVQKETYGDRTVYYPRTNDGREELMATEFAEKIYRNHKFVYLLIGFAMLTVMWPRELYSLVRYYAGK